ncbi:MAG: redox-sensing transcriptional repressor Rex [Gracilibacteraceae bacterium]|nr:redox-sensing transcriptional repressor Rex [Gracilibacteraceae bacterium]
MKFVKIPLATIMRMSVYSRYLIQMDKEGKETVSSADIAAGASVTPAQVRKDLAYFGEFGVRGVGYRIKDLIEHIKEILNLNNEWRLALVGVGSLGRALIAYQGFRENGFVVSCAFDSDPTKIGEFFAGVEVFAADRIREVARQREADIGVICVPAPEAQSAADALVAGGVKSILNFAPASLTAPFSVHVRHVDLASQLEALAFLLGDPRHG